MSADIAQNLWSLVCSCLDSHWGFHSFPILTFFLIGCFVHWIQSVYNHLLCSLYDNEFPLYLWSPSGLLCWWIFIVPDVVLNLVYLSIFPGLAVLMSADIAQNLWSLVCSCLNSYWAFHLFPLLIFFKLVTFCTEFNLFTPIYFVLFMIIFSPIFVITKWATLLVDIHCFRCCSQLVYLSFFQGLAALMTADIAQNLWSLVCSCLNSFWVFHLFPLLIFFKLVAFCTEFNLFTTICFVLFMRTVSPIFVITKWATLLVDIHCSWCGS